MLRNQYSIPSAHNLYQELISQKFYWLICKKDLVIEAELNKIKDCITHLTEPKELGSDYFEFIFKIVKNHNNVRCILDELKYGVFKNIKFVPLKEIEFTYLNYIFRNKVFFYLPEYFRETDELSKRLPLNYRSQVAYECFQLLRVQMNQRL